MIRFAHQDDLPFLKWMLYEAAYPETGKRPPFEKGIRDPNVAVYLDGWWRKGDAGLIVATEVGGPLGAAWYRLFTTDAHGRGFVDEQTPELVIALSYETRGRGIGTQLLRNLMSLAGKQKHTQISLWVQPSNQGALRVFERVGFNEVASDDPIKMVADLTVPIPDPAAGT